MKTSFITRMKFRFASRKVLEEILENAIRIEQKQKALDKSLQENARRTDEIITRLIRSHPRREELENIWNSSASLDLKT